MKKLVVILAVVVVLVVVLGLVARYFISRPLYQPGMVRAAAITVPPQQQAAGFWEMENGIRLRYFTDGSGANVLFVHGGPGFPPHEPPPGLARLNAKYRFVYYDQRGCGQSSRPIDRFSSSNYYQNLKTLDARLGLGAQIADIERIRRILGDEKLILIGHSFGGFIASLYAAEFPERIKALVLVAPADMLVMPPAHDLFAILEKKLPEKLRPEFASFRERYFDFRNIFGRSEADLRALNLEMGKYYTAAVNMPMPPGDDNGGWMVYAMYFSMGQKHDYRAALKSVTAPVLLVHGENDLVPEAVSRSYVAAFPAAKLVRIAGAGHMPFLDRPEDFAAAVGGFLGGL